VLSPWGSGTEEAVGALRERGADALEAVFTKGFTAAMNQFNAG
jgi:hypothetical protein